MSCYVHSFQGTSPVTNNKWLISFCLFDWTAASWMQMQMCFRFLPELMLGLIFRRLERDQKTRQLQSGVWGCKQPVWRCHLIALLWHHKGVFLCKTSRGRQAGRLMFFHLLTNLPDDLLNLKALSNRLHVFTNTKSCTDSSNPLIEKVKLCDAFSIQGAAVWIQWGYWSSEMFLYLLPWNAAHAISCSSAVLAGESGGARINEKWALHEIYIRIIRCNIHLSLLPQAWLHARSPECARTQAPRTQRRWGS